MEKIWLKSYDKHVPESLTYKYEDFGTILTRAMEAFPDRVAFYFMKNVLTYREVLELSRKFATFLQKNGLKKGDVVAMK
jgi:long-chain acyl-CoA synthetase